MDKNFATDYLTDTVKTGVFQIIDILEKLCYNILAKTTNKNKYEEFYEKFK